jgi:hypothetical protein
MYAHPNDQIRPENISIADEVIAYIQKRKCDFRVSTSCGGPMLLPVSMKPPKPTDLQVKAGDYTIFISVHQIRYLHSIHMDMIPLFFEHIEDSPVGE